MTQRAEETRKSESCAVMAQIGPSEGGDTQPERVQTSGRSFVTRELEETLKEGKQMKAEKPACAPSEREVNWNRIDWATANQNVKRLQARIVKATQES